MLDIHANKIIANKFVGEFENNNNGFNVGDIKWSATDLTQVGFLVANGASIRKDTYTDLYNAIGTKWGSVDEEHFNLPNLIGRFIEGASEAGGYKEAGLPNITGTTNATDAGNYIDEPTNGAFYRDNPHGTAFTAGTGPLTDLNIHFDASRSNSIYGNSDTVQPNSALLTPYIKAFAGASASSTDLEITKVANDVANKANRNLSNLSEIGRKAFFPSDTYITIEVTWTPVSGIAGAYRYTYTAPANGFVHISGVPYGTSGHVAIVNNKIATACSYNQGNSLNPSVYCHAKKDDIITFETLYTNPTCHFIYAEDEV